MFDPSLFLAFLVAATVLTVTPGVDTAMVLRSAASHGAKSGASAGAGILIGCLFWGAAVSLGLGAVLQASELAYAIVKWAGAAYLLWIGVALLVRPREALSTGNAPRTTVSTAFRRGFLTNLLNPKVGIFYVTFLPQFVPHGANVAAYSFFLAVTHAVLTIAWFAMLIVATVPLGRFLQRPRVIKMLDRITGGIFVVFGLKLAASRV